MTKPGHPPASIQPKTRRRVGFAAPVRAVVQRVLLLAVAMVIIAASILAGIGGRSTSLLMPGSSGYRGLELWRSHGCGTCHALFGLGGHIGPDLTNVMRRRNRAFMRHVLRHGMGAMPPFDLGDDPADALIAYLQHLDGLGTYPLESAAAPAFGIQPWRE